MNSIEKAYFDVISESVTKYKVTGIYRKDRKDHLYQFEQDYTSLDDAKRQAENCVKGNVWPEKYLDKECILAYVTDKRTGRKIKDAIFKKQ